MLLIHVGHRTLAPLVSRSYSFAADTSGIQHLDVLNESFQLRVLLKVAGHATRELKTGSPSFTFRWGQCSLSAIVEQVARSLAGPQRVELVSLELSDYVRRVTYSTDADHRDGTDSRSEEPGLASCERKYLRTPKHDDAGGVVRHFQLRGRNVLSEHGAFLSRPSIVVDMITPPIRHMSSLPLGPSHRPRDAGPFRELIRHGHRC